MFTYSPFWSICIELIGYINVTYDLLIIYRHIYNYEQWMYMRMVIKYYSLQKQVKMLTNNLHHIISL